MSRLPVLALLVAATFWGLIWYPLRLLEQGGLAGPWQTLVSYAVAALVFVPFCRSCWRGVSAHPWQLAVLAVAAGLTNVAFVLGLLEGSVVRVLILFYLSPVWTVILAHFLLRERLHPSTLVTIPVGLGGALLLLWQPRVGSLFPLALGDWLGLASGVGFALNNVMARRLQGASVRLKTLTSWVGVVVLSVPAIALFAPQLPQVETQIWVGAGLVGLFGFMLVTLATIYGVTHLPAQRAAVIMLFEVLVGAASAWLLAGEALGMREWIGGGLVLAVGLYAAVKEQKHE